MVVTADNGSESSAVSIRMSLPPAKQTATAIAPSINFTIGPDDEDFSVPLKSLVSTLNSSKSAWTLNVPSEQSVNREKAKTLEPLSFSRQTLSVPGVDQPNMSRRASCPNFEVPEFNFVPQENKRLLSAKRPSLHDIMSHKFFNQSYSHSLDSKLKPKAPYSPISEQPEISLTNFEGQQNVANSSAPFNDSNKIVKAAEMQTVKKHSGFFSSTVSSLFSANQLDKSNSSLIENKQIDSVSPAPEKKSYLLRRASAMSNADMNAMAPTSM